MPDKTNIIKMEEPLLTKAIKVFMAETMYSAKIKRNSLSPKKKAKIIVPKEKGDLTQTQKDSVMHDEKPIKESD